MTRAEFISRLRAGLGGISAAQIADIVADYETHFEDGKAAGRSEAEVAEALGNPARLARELKAEEGLRRWEENKTPGNARNALWALLGLGALDLFILTTLLWPIFVALFLLLVACVAVFVVGVFILFAWTIVMPPGGVATAILLGTGFMAFGVSFGALLGLICVGLVNAVVWYARLHLRLLKPAIEPQS
jgi:uncharacterized membrane protein